MSVSSHIPNQVPLSEEIIEKVVRKIKSIFPKNENEIEMVKFIARFQYLYTNDAKYFFNDTYYPKRIRNLIQKNIIRRYNKYLVLAENGQYFMKVLGQKVMPLRYEKKYTDRLKFISHLAAIYYKDKNIEFTPSNEIKDKNVFTETSRKYIGILKIFGTSYLTYHISDKHTKKYINTVMYDLQKETKYKNILILVDDIKRIELRNFIFGFNSLIICEDNDEQLLKLKYIQQINWPKIVQTLYKGVHISEYNFCDYTNNKDRYIATFYLIDTEKINRINVFLENNKNKQVDIICGENIIRNLGQEMPLVNYNLIKLSDFIEDIRIYD